MLEGPEFGRLAQHSAGLPDTLQRVSVIRGMPPKERILLVNNLEASSCFLIALVESGRNNIYYPARLGDIRPEQEEEAQFNYLLHTISAPFGGSG